MNNTIKSFAAIAFFEGLSYMVLLAIAMPLKYFFDFPQAVKVVGWAHGLLFMLYVALLLTCWIKCRWSFWRVCGYFIASLLPIVPFIVERQLKNEYLKRVI
jgi:integral membrane protein